MQALSATSLSCPQGTIDNLTSTNLSLTDIVALTGNVADLTTALLTFTTITGANGTFSSLASTSSTVINLTSTEFDSESGTISDLSSDTITVSDTVTSASLVVSTASCTGTATIGTISCPTGTIDEFVADDVLTNRAHVQLVDGNWNDVPNISYLDGRTRREVFCSVGFHGTSAVISDSNGSAIVTHVIQTNNRPYGFEVLFPSLNPTIHHSITQNRQAPKVTVIVSSVMPPDQTSTDFKMWSTRSWVNYGSTDLIVRAEANNPIVDTLTNDGNLFWRSVEIVSFTVKYQENPPSYLTRSTSSSIDSDFQNHHEIPSSLSGNNGSWTGLDDVELKGMDPIPRYVSSKVILDNYLQSNEFGLKKELIARGYTETFLKRMRRSYRDNPAKCLSRVSRGKNGQAAS